jgi:hypothetical protein
MALTEYTLQDVVTVAGTFKFTLYADVGLTVPTGQTIMSIGELEKVGDLEPNKKQFQNLSLSIADDYTVYDAGFWYTIALSEMYLRIYLDEGAGDTGYFYGFIDPMQSDFQEHYVGSLDFVRSGTMVLTSVEAKLFATTLTTLNDAVVANKILTNYFPTDTPVTDDIYSYIMVKDFFSALLFASGLNPDYSASDTRVVYSQAVNEQDFVYYETDSLRTYFVDQLFLVMSRYVEAPPGSGNWVENTFTNLTWYDLLVLNTTTFDPSSYVTQLIIEVLNSIQFNMELGYESGRHVITLYQRGRAYGNSNNVTMGGLLSSRINVCSDLRKSGYKAYNDNDTTKMIWFSDKVDALPKADGIPETIEIEVAVSCALRVINTAPGIGSAYAVVPYGISSDEDMWEYFHKPYDCINSVKYWNYETSAYVVASIGGDKLLEEAVAGYLFARFHTAFRAFTRTYATLKANNGSTNTHTNNHPFMRTAFDDGTGSKQYYANKVIKNADNNTTTVDWIEE